MVSLGDKAQLIHSKYNCGLLPTFTMAENAHFQLNVLETKCGIFPHTSL